MTLLDPVEAPTTVNSEDTTTILPGTETTTEALTQNDDIPDAVAAALQSQEPDLGLDIEADTQDDIASDIDTDTQDDITSDIDTDVQDDSSDELSSTTETSKLSSFSSSLSEAVSAVTSTVSSLFDQEPTEDFSEIENSSANLDQPSVVIANIEESLNDADAGEDKVDNDSSASHSLSSVQKPQNEVFDIIDESQDTTTTVSATTEGEIEFDDPSSYDYAYDDFSGDYENSGSTSESSASTDITVSDIKESETTPKDETTVATTPEDTDKTQSSESSNVSTEGSSGFNPGLAETEGNTGDDETSCSVIHLQWVITLTLPTT